MNRTHLLMAGLLLSAGLAGAQTPAITSVGNGASYDTKLAPGGYFVAFGTNLGPATIATNALPYKGDAGGTSVKFTPVAGGTAIDAWMYYAAAGQISGILPSTAAPGDYNMTVSFGATSAPFKVTVLDHNFGIFTTAQSGSGPAIVQNYTSDSEQPVNGFTTVSVNGTQFAPAIAGKTKALVLWGTGLGASPTPDNQGSGTANDLRGPNLSASVLIGGTEYQVDLYAGRSPQFPGIDQINVTLPANALQGCIVSLQVKVNGAVSNLTSLSLAPDGQTACQSEYLSTDQLTRLMNGGTITSGFLNLSHQSTSITAQGSTFNQVTENLAGSFGKYTLGTVGNLGGAPAAILTTSIGGCTVIQETFSGANLNSPPGIPLDAGSQLTLNGPGVPNKAVPKSGGAYNVSLSQIGSSTSLIQAGEYTVTGPGGADVGQFTASLTVPAPLTWTNQSSITSIDRSQPLGITWTGGGSGYQVAIEGYSGSTNTTTKLNTATIFVCLADSAAGSFTVPPAVLLQLPVSSGDITSGALGFLTVQEVSSAKFTAPLLAGGNVDNAVFSSAYGGANMVPFK